MSESSRRAVHAVRKATERTGAAVQSVIRLLDAAKTVEDISAAKIWARSQPVEWFYRTSAQDKLMQDAYARAKQRVKGGVSHERD